MIAAPAISATRGRTATSSAIRKSATSACDRIRIAGSMAWVTTWLTSLSTLAPSLALWFSRNQV